MSKANPVNEIDRGREKYGRKETQESAFVALPRGKKRDQVQVTREERRTNTNKTTIKMCRMVRK